LVQAEPVVLLTVLLLEAVAVPVDQVISPVQELI